MLTINKEVMTEDSKQYEKHFFHKKQQESKILQEGQKYFHLSRCLFKELLEHQPTGYPFFSQQIQKCKYK